MATLYNENSAALINGNFDFSLVKVEVPPEFNALGSTISHNRRVDAEEGILHKTARRLGALFGDVLPGCKDLCRAYGKRVSEISSMPNINPQKGSERETIFSSHLGADTTSIWAAATSGTSAIAVHLLACMLARIFTGPEAISVWVELVQKQKERIRSQQDDVLYAHENQALVLAAQQDIQRSDLAKWDASARAWLQSADEAKTRQHKQAMLILANASVPINSETQVYPSVIKAWSVALEAMNSLVKGIPQRVHDGAALLALSSWHLYPDMVFYGESCVEVKQKDPLFDSAAILTLGLQQVRNDTKSVYWSLPLAYLQHYGHPIRTCRTLDQENVRISFQQFAFVLIGCLFESWQEFASDNEQGIQWLKQLGRVCRVSTDYRIDQAHARPCAWLVYLLQSIGGLNDCDESEKRTARQLMNLGRRKSKFIQFPGSVIRPLPVFDMSRIDTLLPLCSTVQHRVELLRRYCSSLGLDGSDFLILLQPAEYPKHAEYATVKPVTPGSSKRMFDGSFTENGRLVPRHIRWVSLTFRQLQLCNRYIEVFTGLFTATHHLKTLKDREVKMINHGVDDILRMGNPDSIQEEGFRLDGSSGQVYNGRDLIYNRQTPRDREKHIQSLGPLSFEEDVGQSIWNGSHPAPTNVVYMDQSRRSELVPSVTQSVKSNTPPLSTRAPKRSRNRDHAHLRAEISELEEVIAICERKRYVESLGELYLPISEYPKEPSNTNKYTWTSNGILGDEMKSSLSSSQKDLVFSRKEEFLEALQDLIYKLQHYARFMITTSIYHFAGASCLAALYSFRPLETLQQPMLSPQLLKDFATEINLEPGKVAEFMSQGSRNGPGDQIRLLTSCTMMAEVYKLLPGATVSTLIVNQTLTEAKWLPSSYGTAPLTREQAFAGIAMFESGTCNIDPQSLSEVFAMSSGNSLFVSGALLCDPFEVPASNEIRRVIGNVGRAGLTFLISPPEVKVREADAEKWMAINHNKFDGKPEDHFEQTSIHLSFTEYEIPLVTEGSQRHIIDRAVVLVETLISIYDGGRWVGEADILKALNGDCARATGCELASGIHVQHKAAFAEQFPKDSGNLVTSVENWDELIEAPSKGQIAVRAHGNWLARLAATAICARLSIRPFMLPKEVCWQCCQAATTGLENDRLGLIY